ncbi:MAG: IS5 family transposase [Proteobacteria bacterium]|nr:IS5 family transposase [Pseudomonadota bacterium]
MRGHDIHQQKVFSYLSPEARVPQDHPLRPIRTMADAALKKLSPVFHELYAKTGRPSIPPEQLLRSLLLQIFYTIRSERMLVEQLDYNLLFRWFVGLSMDETIWNHSVYSKNRERLLPSDIAVLFLRSICSQAEEAGLLSDDHFTVDGTLIESWASLKSFHPRDEEPHPSGGGRNPEVDFHGEKRSNATHVSVSDPESQLYKKGEGKEARLYFMGHILMENRNGLAVDTRVTPATGIAEREAGLSMVADVPGRKRITIGADKGYDYANYVTGLRRLNATPHVAQKVKGSAIDGRTTRHAGYAVSQRKRKRVEEIFGWMKTIAWLRKARYKGEEKIDWLFTLSAAAYNMVRMRNLGMIASG